MPIPYGTLVTSDDIRRCVRLIPGKPSGFHIASSEDAYQIAASTLCQRSDLNADEIIELISGLYCAAMREETDA